MSEAIVRCSGCGQSYKLTSEQVTKYAGRSVPCPACKQPFTVPSPAAPPTAVPAAVPPPLPTPVAPYATPGSFSPVPRKSSGAAVASLILGIAGFCLPVLASIPAIILGIIGIRKAQQPAVGGRGLAITGVILGCVSAVMVPLLLSILLPAFANARERAFRIRCAANLRSIGQGCMLYANDYRVYPGNLGLLVNYDMAPDVFACPATGGAGPVVTGTPKEKADWINRNSHYVYLGAKLTPSSAYDAIVAYEKPENHASQGINILFNDGSVAWWTMSQAKQLIEQQTQGK